MYVTSEVWTEYVVSIGMVVGQGKDILFVFQGQEKQDGRLVSSDEARVSVSTHSHMKCPSSQCFKLCA